MCDYDVDVLIIGGGGAGASAAIEADKAGAKVDDRDQAAHRRRQHDDGRGRHPGGRQAQRFPGDSLSGRVRRRPFRGQARICSPSSSCDAPEAIQWLNDLGVEFDKAPDGTMITTHGGGTSRKRMHAAKDYSGAEIMRTLRDEVLNRGIPVVDFTAAIELILDENGKAAGAVLLNMETQGTDGCAGQDRHHRDRRRGTHALSGLPDLEPLRRDGGRPGAGLPRGREAALCGHAAVSSRPARPIPQQIFGALVTEKVRSLGAKLVNRDGKVFMHPLETRDVAAASIIRECSDRDKGVDTGSGEARLAGHPDDRDAIGGEGTIEKRIPAMMRMFAKLWHRYPQGADPRLSDAALSERRPAISRRTA